MRTLILALIILSLTSCSTAEIYSRVVAWNETPGKSVSMRVGNVDFHAGNGWATYNTRMTVFIYNGYDFPVMIPENSMNLETKNGPRECKETPQRTLVPGQSTSFVLKCRGGSNGALPIVSLMAIYKVDESSPENQVKVRLKPAVLIPVEP